MFFLEDRSYNYTKTKICPIFKKGDKNLFEKHRPILILSNFGKLFEVIIHFHTPNFLLPTWILGR